jgi:hypothetical protein
MQRFLNEEKEIILMPEIKTQDYGIFSVDVCQNCFSYRFKHDPKLFFHRINEKHLKNQKRPLIVPKGPVSSKHYLYYLRKKSIHLGPLYTQPLTLDNPEAIWFGFDINDLKSKYPVIKFLNYDVWPELVLHRDLLTQNERISSEQRLYQEDYSTEHPTLVVLPDALDTTLSKVSITRTPEGRVLADEFSGRTLDTILFTMETAQRIKKNYRENLWVKNCPCGFG